MQFLKKIFSRIQKEDGLINTTDLLVATAATVVLAAGVGGAVLSTLDEANYGKAQPDAQAMAQAVMTFYKDTGKWPGQAYHANNATEAVILATSASTTTTTVVTEDDPNTVDVDESATTTTTSVTGSTLPQVANDGLRWDALNGTTKCTANSGEGFVNKTIAAGPTSTDAEVITGVTVLNINDFLVRQPPAADYPNWGGPYLQEIDTDPWQRAWLAYLTPLYCSETVTETDGSGKLGYAWLLTGGTNRTITTPATNSNLDENGDDAGVNLGKLSTQNSGSVSQ